MRKETFDLAEGFDRVRWGDDAETVRSFYPDARTPARRVGVDPRTGERIVRHAGGLVMSRPDIAVPVPSEALILGLSVGFDEQGVTQLERSSHGPLERHADLSDDELTEVVMTYAERTARELGLEPSDPGRAEQEWSVGDVRVRLLLEWDGFHFRFERPRP